MLLDEILIKYVDQAHIAACLRRNGGHATCDGVFAEVLAELEARGDAMRFMDPNGQIAWKATPRLRNWSDGS